MASGLTYSSDKAIEPGSLVLVPLRNSFVEGIVLGCTEPTGPIPHQIKAVKEVIGDWPLLSHAQIQTLLWMCEYYLCTPRHALQVFLPEPPWRNVIDIAEPLLAIKQSDVLVKGKKQQEALEYLKSNGPASRTDIMEATGVSAVTIKTMMEREVLLETKPEITTPKESYISIGTIENSDADRTLASAMLKELRPNLLLDETASSRSGLFAEMIAEKLRAGKDAILLEPTIADAEEMFGELQKLLGDVPLHLLTSSTPLGARRALLRRIKTTSPNVIVGTRTAIFAPLHALGLVIVDEEHERTYKSEQTPRYHARLTAEALCRSSGAKLVLASATPSLESLRHATLGDTLSRYTLCLRKNIVPAAGTSRPGARIIDLTQADFGLHYPLTPPITESLVTCIKKNETAVLVLNRKGIASSMLCFECKRPILAPGSEFPMSVMQASGKQWLFDRMTGLKSPIPEVCPNCGGARLKAVGAGTEGVEQTLHKLFPNARITRVDASTLDEPKALSKIFESVNAGSVDILIGTQPVLRMLRSPRVTFAAVLVADIGLSVPDFRAGERVFGLVSSVVNAMRKKNADCIIQTFRPEATEIKHAVDGDHRAYLDSELQLRERAGYPPASQIIALIIRRDKAKATHIHREALKLAEGTGTIVTMVDESQPGNSEWRIFLRGKKPRTILAKLPLQGVVVDVDPIE